MSLCKYYNGICLYSSGSSCRYDYDYWIELMNHIIIATIKHLKDKYDKNNYRYFIEVINGWEIVTSTITKDYRASFVEYIRNSDLNYRLYNEIVGLFYLLDIDSDYIHSIYKSQLICKLLEQIKPYVSNNEEYYDYYDAIYYDEDDLDDYNYAHNKLYHLFEDSSKTSCRVNVDLY